MDSAAALWSANISHKCINFPFSTKRRGKIVKKLSEWSSRIEHYHQDSETAVCGVDEKPTWNLRNVFSFIWHLFSFAIPFNIFNSSFTALYDQMLHSRASEDSFILTTIPSWAFEWNIKELKLNTSASIILSYFLDQSSSWAEKVRRRQNRKLKMSEKRDCLGNFSLSIIKSPEFVARSTRKFSSVYCISHASPWMDTKNLVFCSNFSGTSNHVIRIRHQKTDIWNLRSNWWSQ